MKRFALRLFSMVFMLLLCGAVGTAQAEEGQPIAENQELKTYRNCSVGGRLKGYGGEGERLSFQLTTKPVKGTVELEEDGSFLYTPREGKRGRDYFGYKVSDGKGRVSQEATVIIRIEKQKGEVCYPELQGNAEEYAAVYLSEKELFTGEQIAGRYCFQPEKPVSRGEFLSLCLALTGAEEGLPVLKTGFADEEQIPRWVKERAWAASAMGIYPGQQEENGAVFSAEEPITKTEAALLLNRTMALNAVQYLPLDPALPMEAAQACVNLSGCGIIEQGTLSDTVLTRADMAQMLANAATVIENR